MWYLYIGAVFAVLLLVWILFEVLHVGDRRLNAEEARNSLLIMVFGPPGAVLAWPLIGVFGVWWVCDWLWDEIPPAYQRWYNRRVDRARDKRILAEAEAKAKRLEETKYFP